MIDEKNGRWVDFDFIRPRDRVDAFGEKAESKTAPHKRAVAKTRQVQQQVQTVRKQLPETPDWMHHALNAFKSATLRDPRAVSPPVAVTGVFVFGFAFMILIAAIASPSMRRQITSTPLIAAVSEPVASALDAATGNSDDDDPIKKKTAVPADQPSTAADGIPADKTVIYEAAAKTCNMPWEVLAAVGRVETNHGQSNARGVHSGANYAGAEGPMQFLPATWAKYGVDANGDGHKDIYDQTDAIYGAANYLCANGAKDGADLDNALWHYNHDTTYVSHVMSIADDYSQNAYAMPVSNGSAATLNFDKPHHDYSADDIPMPVNTQVFAVRGGTAHVSKNSSCGNELQIDGTDGARYTYCHASSIDVNDGDEVKTGDPALKSGGLAGAEGAGDSTGPHLHLQISVDGTNVCPQPLLDAWRNGNFETPDQAPTSGCSY